MQEVGREEDKHLRGAERRKMAATKSPSKTKHSRFLFIHENGDPMIFYMRPCAERSNLKPDIEHGGGEVTAKVVKHSIKLAGDADYISTDDYYSTRFIKDCVKANKILDLETYRLNISKSLKSQIQNAVEDTVSDISDDESDLTRIYKTQSRDFKGRMAFTKEEDLAMLKYIIDNHRQRDIQGKLLYREMEFKKVTSHTASSMNCRFRKVIMPNLDRYEIDMTWKHKLTGDPKYTESTVKTSTISDNRLSVQVCDVNVKSPPSKVLSNTKKSDSESPDDKVRFRHKEWISKDKGQVLSKSYSKGDRVKMLRNTRRKDESSSKKQEDDNSDHVMSDEDSFDIALLNSANLRKYSEKSSSQLVRNLRSQDNINTSSNKSSPKKRQIPNSGGDNNIDHVDNSRKSKRLHPENENTESIENPATGSPVKKSQKIASTRNNEQTESVIKHSIMTPPKKQKSKTKDDSDDEEAGPSSVSNNSTARNTHKVSNHSSPQKHPSSPRKHQLSPRKHPSSPQKHPSSPRKHPSSPQKHPSSPRKHQLSPRKHPSSPQTHPSSLSPQKSMSSPQKKTRSSPNSLIPQMNTSAKSGHETTSPSTSKRSKYLKSRVDYIMDTNIDSQGSQSQSSQPETMNGTDDQYENAREILKFIHKISVRYNLTHEEARHCLWINNGSFDDTIAWILTGYNCSGQPPWDHRDDEGLNSADGIKRLIKKYGIDAVHERQYFLEL